MSVVAGSSNFVEAPPAQTDVRAKSADAVVYAAQVDAAHEPAIVRALTDAMAGSGRTLVFLSGTGVFMQRTGGAWSPDSFAEADPFEPEPLALSRVEAEGTVHAAAAQGLRSMVIRPPVIWGPGDNGPLATVYRSVATTGTACYVGSGPAASSNVHSTDLARLFEMALDHGIAGALYHAVAGEIPYRWIAEAVARHGCGHAQPDHVRSRRGLRAVRCPAALGMQPITDPRTRAELGWAPTHLDMLSQIGEPRLRALATAHLQPGAQP